MSTGQRESRLARWSRRKLEARQAEAAPVESRPEVAAESIDETPQVESPPLTDADMPPLDSLSSESDFSPFMSAGVSDVLRNRALRKLFAAPSFNIRDGLDEYDEDYTTFEKLGDIVTADMKHRVEMDKEKLLRRLAEAEADEADEAAKIAESGEADGAAEFDSAELNDQQPLTESAESGEAAALTESSAPTKQLAEPRQVASLETNRKPLNDD